MIYDSCRWFVVWTRDTLLTPLPVGHNKIVPGSNQDPGWTRKPGIPLTILGLQSRFRDTLLGF